MRHNLFQLYKDTKEFTELPGSRVGKAIRGMWRATMISMGSDGTLLKGRTPEGKLDYEVLKTAYGAYSMYVYRPDKTLEEEHVFYPNQKNLTVNYFDANGTRATTRDIYTIVDSELHLQEKYHYPPGTDEEHYTKYIYTGDGRTLRDFEDISNKKTGNRILQTKFNDQDQPDYNWHYDADGKAIRHEQFHPTTQKIAYVEEKKDGRKFREQYFREDGTLETSVEYTDDRHKLELKYREDGETVRLRTETRDNQIQRVLEFHESNPSQPESIILYQDGKPYERRDFNRKGKQTGQHSYNPDTGMPTESRYKHGPGDVEYKYFPKSGKLRSAEYRRKPFSGEETGARQYYEEYHPDGETPSLRINYDTAEDPVNEQRFYPTGITKSTIGFADGKRQSKVTYGRDGESILQEVEYREGKKQAETLHHIPDTEIDKIDRTFFPSGNVRQEIVHYIDGCTAELTYRDGKPPRIAMETLNSPRGDILVRRLYNEDGTLKDSTLNMNADDKWQNRVAVQQSRRVFNTPLPKAIMTELDDGKSFEGDVHVFSGIVSLTLQGDRDELMNARRRIEAKLKDAACTLEKRQQVGNQTGDYFGGGRTWVPGKAEQWQFGIPRREVDVLVVKQPYRKEQPGVQEWPKKYYSSYGHYDDIAQDDALARKKAVELARQVHRYTDFQLGVKITPEIRNYNGNFRPSIQIEAGIPGSSRPDGLVGFAVTSLAQDKLGKKKFSTSWSSGGSGGTLYLYSNKEFNAGSSATAEADAQKEADQMAKQAGDILRAPEQKAERSAG